MDDHRRWIPLWARTVGRVCGKVMLPALLSVMSASTARGAEPPVAPCKAVAKDDPDRTVLQEWQDGATKAYEESGLIEVDFAAWEEIDSPVLARLFPSYRFYTTSWKERATKRGEEEGVSCAWGLEATLSVHRETKEVRKYLGWGNYEPFGQFLQSEKVKIASEEDARLVWDAFCDLHRKRWKSQGIKRIGPKVWHLGLTTIDDTRYYYEVNLDETGIVVSARLHSEKVGE